MLEEEKKKKREMGRRGGGLGSRGGPGGGARGGGCTSRCTGPREAVANWRRISKPKSQEPWSLWPRPDCTGPVGKRSLTCWRIVGKRGRETRPGGCWAGAVWRELKRQMTLLQT